MPRHPIGLCNFAAPWAGALPPVDTIASTRFRSSVFREFRGKIERVSERPVKSGATYEDVLEAPEGKVAEVIDGDLYLSPRPASRHGRVSSTLGMILGPAFDFGTDGPGGWWLIDEPELHLGPQIVVPDLGAWRRERMPLFPDVAYFELPPDWISEVLSPSTSRLDRLKKLPVYAACGVPHAWLIDPLKRTLEIYGLDRGSLNLVSAYVGEESVRAAPFDAIPLELRSLWI